MKNSVARIDVIAENATLSDQFEFTTPPPLLKGPWICDGGPFSSDLPSIVIAAKTADSHSDLLVKYRNDTLFNCAKTDISVSPHRFVE